MKVVDSSGWLEYFGKGANGERFAPAIQDSRTLLVPVICLYEVYKRVALQRGEEDALQAVAWMMTGTVVEINPEIALTAAQLSLEHRLPMADSLILAAARLHNAELWTQDEHFKGLDQVVYMEKPKST
jgi:toxin FitB